MIRVNGVERPWAAVTVADLVEQLGVGARGVAVALDGEIVPRSRWGETAVPDASAVEIVTAAAGG